MLKRCALRITWHITVRGAIHHVTYSLKLILPVSTAIRHTAAPPPTLSQPTTARAIRPTSSIIVCTASAHTTAFMPPYTQQHNCVISTAICSLYRAWIHRLPCSIDRQSSLIPSVGLRQRSSSAAFYHIKDVCCESGRRLECRTGGMPNISSSNKTDEKLY